MDILECRQLFIVNSNEKEDGTIGTVNSKIMSNRWIFLTDRSLIYVDAIVNSFMSLEKYRDFGWHLILFCVQVSIFTLINVYTHTLS